MYRTTVLKTALTIVTLAAACNALAGRGLRAAEPPENGQAATRLLRITFDHRLPLGVDGLHRIAMSDSVLSSAAREIDGLHTEEAPGIVWVNFEMIGDSGFFSSAKAILAQLDVVIDARVPDAGEKAEQLVTAVADRIEMLILETAERGRHELQMCLDKAEEDYAHARDRLEEVQRVQQELFTEAGTTQLGESGSVFASRLGGDEIAENIPGLRMEIVALEARSEAITERIAMLGERTGVDKDDHPVLRELAKVVEIRRGELSRIQHLAERGSVGNQELEEVQLALAMAEAELHEARMKLVERGRGELLAALNEQLIDVGVEIAEKTARLEFLEDRLEEIRRPELLELRHRYERDVEIALPIAQQALKDAAVRKARIEQEWREFYEPTVSIMGDFGGHDDEDEHESDGFDDDEHERAPVME